MDDAHSLISDIEEHVDVNVLRHGDTNAWPYLRLVLIWLLEAKRVPALEAADSIQAGSRDDFEHRYLTSLERLCSPDLKAAISLQTLNTCDVLFWGKAPVRPTVAAGVRIDAVVDPIVSQVESSRAKWDKIYLSEKGSDDGVAPLRRSSVVDPAPFAKASRDIRNLSQLQQGARPFDEVSGWEQFRDSVSRSRRLMDRISSVSQEAAGRLQSDSRWLANELNNIRDMENFAGMVLDRTKPGIVFVVGQNRASFGMVAAARKRGVLSVDIHHGAASGHLANIKWFGWKQIPEGGYHHLPDVSWVWNREAADRINGSLGGDTRYHNAVVGGNAWLSACAALTGGPAEKRESGELTVLVTLTNLSVEEPPELLWEAMRNAPSGWRWLLRLHPGDLADKSRIEGLAAACRQAGNRNVELERPSSEPLPNLFAQADRHVTMYSSACLEATYFGLGTVFVSPKAKTMFGDLIGQPGFSYASNAGELVGLLEKGVGKPERLVESGPELTARTVEALLSRAGIAAGPRPG